MSGRLKRNVSLFVLLGAVFASAQQPGEIRGTVEDQTGALIPRAQLLLINIETLQTWQEAGTNGGDFVFRDLPAGDYELRVAYRPFLPYGKRIRLKPDRGAAIKVVLKVDPHTKVIE